MENVLYDPVRTTCLLLQSRVEKIYEFVKPRYLQDEEAFMENNAASPPVYILNAACVEQKDYVKRKHVFKLATTVFSYLS